MILMTSANDLMQVVTASAGSILVHVSYVDNVGGTLITPLRTNTAIGTAGTTTAVASPATGQRNVQTFSVYNTHANSNLTEARHTDGTTVSTLFKATLLTGEKFEFVDGAGWSRYDATGTRQTGATATGRFLKNNVLTSGTSWTSGLQTTSIFVRMVGGGGGGGGCTSVAAACAGAGGGGGGAYAEKTFVVTPNTAYTYAIGTAGIGVSAAAGSNGGSTTLTVAATILAAFGGVGAAAATPGTALTTRFYAPGAGAAIATSGDVNAAGVPGYFGAGAFAGTQVASGNGGASSFGAGGIGKVVIGAGNVATGYGSGGGGAATGASAAQVGGTATAGVIIIDEYS